MWRLVWTSSTVLTHVVRVLRMLGLFSGLQGRLRFLGTWLALEAKFWFGWFANRQFTLTWDGPAGPVSATLLDLSEVWAIWETFTNGEYESVRDLAPVTILDLGGNIGISALYFAATCPEARIVAVEAVPHTFELLERNTRHLPNVTCIHAAVSGAPGSLTLYSGPRSLASSLVPARDRPNAHVVPAATVEDLAEQAGIPTFDFVKMDVEGAEVQVIDASSAFLQQARAMVFEFHQEHTSRSVWELLAELPGFEVARIRGDSAKRPVIDLVRR